MTVPTRIFSLFYTLGLVLLSGAVFGSGYTGSSPGEVVNSCTVHRTGHMEGNCPTAKSAPALAQAHAQSPPGARYRETYEEWCGPNGPCVQRCPTPGNVRKCDETSKGALECRCNGVLVLWSYSYSSGGGRQQPPMAAYPLSAMTVVVILVSTVLVRAIRA